MNRSRIHAIEALQNAAAIVVVFWHYQFFFNAKPFPLILGAFYADGQVIIDVLFVSSAFGIAFYYFTQSSKLSFRDFLSRRIARLYPLQIVTFGATAIVFYAIWLKTGVYGSVYLNNDVYHAALNLLFLQYIGLQHGYSFNGPSWLISVEFCVSILLILTFFVKSDLCRIVMWAMTAVASALILTSFSSSWSGGPKLWGWLEPNLLRCICGMSSGFLTFRIWLYHRATRAIALSALTAGALCSIFLMSQGARGAHDMIVGAVMSLVCAPLMVYGCAASPILETFGNSVASQWIGNIGYSILMWHFPVAQVLILIGCETMPHSSTWLPFVYLALVLSVSTASHRAIEIPVGRLIFGCFSRRVVSPNVLSEDRFRL